MPYNNGHVTVLIERQQHTGSTSHYCTKVETALEGASPAFGLPAVFLWEVLLPCKDHPVGQAHQDDCLLLLRIPAKQSLHPYNVCSAITYLLQRLWPWLHLLRCRVVHKFPGRRSAKTRPPVKRDHLIAINGSMHCSYARICELHDL